MVFPFPVTSYNLDKLPPQQISFTFSFPLYANIQCIGDKYVVILTPNFPQLSNFTPKNTQPPPPVRTIWDVQTPPLTPEVADTQLYDPSEELPPYTPQPEENKGHEEVTTHPCYIPAEALDIAEEVIIPFQPYTPDSCQSTPEEEICEPFSSYENPPTPEQVICEPYIPHLEQGQEQLTCPPPPYPQQNRDPEDLAYPPLLYNCQEGVLHHPFTLEDLTHQPLPLNPDYQRPKLLNPYQIQTKPLTLCTYPLCQKKFLFQSALLLHLRVHSDEKPFQCSFCGRTFKQNVYLKSHIRIHTGDPESRKLFHCECGKSYTAKGSLTSHLKHVHLDQRDFQCPHCPRRFGVKGAMNQHVASVHLKIRHPCPHCEKSYVNKGYLNVHIRKKHDCHQLLEGVQQVEYLDESSQ